jgi:two-component system, NtrC family, sensor histidine kinase HydH
MTRGFSGVRLVRPFALAGLFALVLCAVLAALLYQQQESVTAALSENVDSRRAAAKLEESLVDLIALLQGQVDGVGPLHDRIREHLEEIHTYADKDPERKLSQELTVSFDRYLAAWNTLPEQPGPVREQALRRLAEQVQGDTLHLARQLRAYNARQIEKSEYAHRRALRGLAWGLLALGGAAALTGLILGYGAARGLRKTIHRLQIGVQDAAGKLGPSWPAIVLTEEGDLDRLHEQVQALVGQVEEVVQRLQQREREVLRAEHLAAVGQLAASVGHEIRNPLTTIKMLVQGAREGPDAPPLSSGDLEIVEQEIRRIERSLKAFLEFARPPKLERVSLDLVALVEQSVTLVRGRAQKQTVTLVFPRPEGPVPAEVDGEQLRQVLVNLLLNALDVLPRGGRIELGLRRIEGQGIEVSVEDSGPGIAAEMLPRLFTPFASSKETGLGLGLVVSRRIVEDHGGKLWGSNRPEGGACFTFRLPAS